MSIVKITITILQLGKLRFKKVRRLAWGHRANQRRLAWSPDSQHKLCSWYTVPGPVLTLTCSHHHSPGYPPSEAWGWPWLPNLGLSNLSQSRGMNPVWGHLGTTQPHTGSFQTKGSHFQECIPCGRQHSRDQSRARGVKAVFLPGPPHTMHARCRGSPPRVPILWNYSPCPLSPIWKGQMKIKYWL